MLRVAAQVGTVAALPHGYITAYCSECGTAVCVRDEWDGVAEDLGVEECILCSACFERGVLAESASGAPGRTGA
jgi:hypothetical protein